SQILRQQCGCMECVRGKRRISAPVPLRSRFQQSPAIHECDGAREQIMNAGRERESGKEGREEKGQTGHTHPSMHTYGCEEESARAPSRSRARDADGMAEEMRRGEGHVPLS